VKVNKQNKVKVHRISIEGNTVFTDNQIRKLLKKTKQQAFYKLLGTGKFTTEKFESDKEKLLSKLQEKGYRDARLV
jgi:outer membrane protein insertion porin family